jgi:phage terminase large subunit GpA-like protein
MPRPSGLRVRISHDALNNQKTPMKYKITCSYNWYETTEDRFIIKTYYINGIAFTFDELSSIEQEDPEIIAKAEQQLTMTPEIFYLKSFYLIDEQAHPMLFEMELENPEVLDELL